MSRLDGQSDDPRRLRVLIDRARELAAGHDVVTVAVGFVAPEQHLLFPEFVDFMESELRVEDSVFRMTRERAVLFLADTSHEQAATIVERLMATFEADFPVSDPAPIRVTYCELRPEDSDLSAKKLLPALFATAEAEPN